MAYDFIKGETRKNYGRQFFILGQDVRELTSPEQKKRIKEIGFNACIAVGLGVISGLVTHNILKYQGER